MARKRRRSRSGGKSKGGGGGGGALGSLRGGFRSIAHGATGAGKPSGAPRAKSSVVMNVVLVLAVAAAGFFLLRRFGILR